MAITLCASRYVLAETTDTIPLAQGLDTAWIVKAFPRDAAPEITQYAYKKVISGRWRTQPLEMRAARVRLNREKYTEADWPYGDRPVCPAIRLSWRVTEEFAGDGRAAPNSSPPGPVNRFCALYFDADSLCRALKFTLSRQDFRGVLFKQFDLWRDPPVMTIHSWRDAEGDTQKYPAWDPHEAVFEEQLWLLVRALKHQKNTAYSLRILDAQETDRAQTPNLVDAEIIPVFARPSDEPAASATDDSSVISNSTPAPTPTPAPKAKDRLFLLQKPGGYTALFRIGAEFPNPLLEWKSGDGRVLEALSSNAP